MRQITFVCAALFTSAILSTPIISAKEMPGQSLNFYEKEQLQSVVGEVILEINNKNYKRAPLLIKAAKLGNGSACNMMGWMFDNGVAVNQDSSKALKWFMSCASTNVKASYNAGVLLFEGRGTNKDQALGAKYLVNAYKIGGESEAMAHPQLPIRLGYYFYDLKNYQEAWKWSHIAATYNHEHGRYLQGRMLMDHTAPVIDEAEASSSITMAISARSGQAAQLLSDVAASKKNYQGAYVYELVADKLLSRKSKNVWGGKLNDDEAKKAAQDAASILRSVATPQPLDFKKTFQ